MTKKRIVYLSPEQITPYDNNPRKNDKAVPYVMESIQKFGFKVPIILDRNNVIVTGHTRYKAALKLGLKEIPCIKADDLSPEQIKAFRLADNKTGEFAQWDFEALAAELDDLTAFDIDMGELGFYSILEDDDFDHLFEPKPATQTKPVVAEKEPPAQQPQDDKELAEYEDTQEPAPAVFRIIVTLDSEEQMREMIERLNEEGYEAREW